MRLAVRSAKLFEEPGIFLIVGKHAICLIPFPRGRA
jgi:hypothetical protein